MEEKGDALGVEDAKRPKELVRGGLAGESIQSGSVFTKGFGPMGRGCGPGILTVGLVELVSLMGFVGLD